MSLEQALADNTAALIENSELLKRALGTVGAAGTTVVDASADGTASTETEKPKRTRRTAEQIAAEKAALEAAAAGGGNVAAATDAPTFDMLKASLTAWLGEFAKEGDKENPAGVHPEITARRDALKATYANPKVAVTKLGELAEDPAKVKLVYNWLENKAKKVDNGNGIGRFVADPSSEPEVSVDDDDEL